MGNEHEIPVRQFGNCISQYSENETAFSVGEKVIWTKNDNSEYGKENGLKNGVTGVIEEITDGVATIKTEYGAVVQQNMEGSYITNGQAITIDKSQGVTAEHVITLMSSDAPPELLSENKAYVALTRMTDGVEIVTDNKDRLLVAVSESQEKSSSLEENRQLLAELKGLVETQKNEISEREEVTFSDGGERQSEKSMDRQQAHEHAVELSSFLEL